MIISSLSSLEQRYWLIGRPLNALLDARLPIEATLVARTPIHCVSISRRPRYKSIYPLTKTIQLYKKLSFTRLNEFLLQLVHFKPMYAKIKSVIKKGQRRSRYRTKAEKDDITFFEAFSDAYRIMKMFIVERKTQGTSVRHEHTKKVEVNGAGKR